LYLFPYIMTSPIHTTWHPRNARNSVSRSGAEAVEGNEWCFYLLHIIAPVDLMCWAWRKTATTTSEYITVQGLGSDLLVVKALTYRPNYEHLIEKVLHAGLRFLLFGSCNLLYALFIFKQVRHTCCLSLHVYVHFIACNCMFCMFLVGYPQTPEPVIPPVRLAQIDLSCVDVP